MLHRRLSRSEWKFAARSLLTDGSIAQVKVSRLAARLRITRGSFYWHFRSRQDLLDALLEDWVTLNQVEMAKLSVEFPGDVDGRLKAFRSWIERTQESSSFDVAIRAWGRSARRVKDVIATVDRAAIDAIRELLLLGGIEVLESQAYAKLLYAFRVGCGVLAEDDLDPLGKERTLQDLLILLGSPRRGFGR